MKVTVLTDNLAGEKLLCEWGLSLYIEHGGHRILLDFGNTDVFAQNAASLGIDLSAVDTAVLSHAHFDHSDGMPYFFALNEQAPVYMQASAKLMYYGINMNGFSYAGIKPGLLQEYADRIRYVSEDTEILPDVWLIRHNPRYMVDVNLDQKLLVQEGDRYIRDTFEHEQSLVVGLPRGLVIFNSCSHGGPLHILQEVRDALPDRPVIGYFGGLHIYDWAPDRIVELGKTFREAGVERICTGHCTGPDAFNVLNEVMGNGLEQSRTGLVWEIE